MKIPISLVIAVCLVAVTVVLLQPTNNLTGCLRNLKQVGQATLLYATDNNGYFPPVADATVESTLNGRWYPGDPELWQTMLLPYAKTRMMFICPTGGSRYTFAYLSPKKFGTTDGWFKLSTNDPGDLVWLTDRVDRSTGTPRTAHGRSCNQLTVDGTVETVRE